MQHALLAAACKGRRSLSAASQNQSITIDGEPYEVDRTVAGAIDEMQNEIETLRNALVRLAVFVGGDPCWCHCEGGKHSKVCRDTLKLRLWPRVTINGRTSYHNNLPWKDPK